MPLEALQQESRQESFEGKVFTNIEFKEKTNKFGVIVDYESRAPGRKTIRIVNGTIPDSGRPYTVRTIADSKPHDPHSGFYTAEIISEDRIADWPDTELTVSVAEENERQLHRARRELYKETGVQHEDRQHMTKSEVSSAAKRGRVAEKAYDKEEVQDDLLERQLGDDDSFARQFISFQRENLRKALRENHKVDVKIASLRKEETDILRSLGGEPSGSELSALREITAEIEDQEMVRAQILASSPEAYYGLHLKQLKQYKENLLDGRIVETPYVQERIADIVAHMRAGAPVMVYGHLGSGKTELALHVARNYILKDRPDIDAVVAKEYDEWVAANPGVSSEIKEKERREIDMSHRSALIISGSKNMSTSELYGHQVLDINKIKKEDLDIFIAEVEGKYNTWLEENEEKLQKLTPDAAEQEKNRAHDRFLQTYLTKFSGGTISSFFLGNIYKAMAEGRPVVIDEINAIPHEILISLNHVLTRKVGDEVNVQQNSGTAITVREGYGVIVTGNLNQGDERYVDRQRMDPAFLSRLYKIEYDYLPQKTEGKLVDEAGGGNELFHLLLARVMDRNGNIELPEGAIGKLWDLAKAARVIQNVFAGKNTDVANNFNVGGGARSIAYTLKESVLSIRGIDKIISQWQKEGYRYELDQYVWSEFVSQSTNVMDKAYLYQLLQGRFGFFADTSWDHNPNYGNGGVIHSFDIKAPKENSQPVEFVGPRTAVAMAYGSGPERTEWPATGIAEAEPEPAEVPEWPPIVLERKKDPTPRDPAKLLTDVFKHIDDDPSFALKSADWEWAISDDGRFVGMSTWTDIPFLQRYIDKEMDPGNPPFNESGSGIGALIERLKGKKVISFSNPNTGMWGLEIVPESSVAAQNKPESAESMHLALKPFLIERFKGWGVDEDGIKLWEQNQAMKVMEPKSLDYTILESDTDSSKFGEYIVNPKTAGVSWDAIPGSKIKPTELTAYEGKTLTEIATDFIKLQDSKKVPGLEYYRYVIENPDKAPDSMKDGKYHFFFGSVFRDSHGLWYVPYVQWRGSSFQPSRLWLGSDWYSDCRAVLLDI